MSDELKPCPHCGVAAKVTDTYHGENEPFYWQAYCVNDGCMADQLSDTKEEAIAAWNIRAEEK